MTSSVVGKEALVEQLAKLDGARLRSYRENLAFYQGQQWPASPRRRERRLVFNYAKAVIDKVASYLMSGVSFVVDAEDASEQAQERARRSEAALRDVFEANNLAQLDFDSEIDASILGDGAYKVTWDADERRVRVSAPDVQGIYAWWLEMTFRAFGGSRAVTFCRRMKLECSTGAAPRASGLWLLREDAMRLSRYGRSLASSCGWTAPCWSRRPTRTDSSRS
jgi:hypothetical protein